MDDTPRGRKTIEPGTVIVWFRRDFRLSDNPALVHATQQGPGLRVLPVYFPSWETQDRWAPGRAARWWLRRSLERLAKELAGLGAPLLLVEGDPREVLPRLAARCGAAEVVWNRLYEPFSRQLESEVANALSRAGVNAQGLSGALLFEPSEHLARSGKPFVQFSAFWRSCLTGFAPTRPLNRLTRLAACEEGTYRKVTDGLPGARLLVEPTDTPQSPRVGEEKMGPVVMEGMPWEPGEAGAWKRLERLIAEVLDVYETQRDHPAQEGVSRLSPHLHFGEISGRQVWWAVSAETSARGVSAFLRQLGWREFAHYLLYHFPHMPDEPFRSEFAGFPWARDEANLIAWQRGSTGFSLVDAGMRQLAVEGWMHNRVRMVVASFLTKDLLIPWQEGAAWFWEHLVDADLANNTLGWQWTAGCGPDAVPYFRIYNPDLQLKRFDAGGSYVRRWLGEAGGPSSSGGRSLTPIVDHAVARSRALAAFRELRAR